MILKKCKKLALGLGLCLGLSIFPSSNILADSPIQKDFVTYSFTQSNNWKQKKHSDKIKELQIPKNILSKMSTDELVESVVNYPFAMDIYAYDSYQKGFESVSRKYNGVKALYERSDAAEKLLQRYNIENDKYKKSWLECILAQKEILNTTTDSERKKINLSIYNNYISAPKSITRGAFYKVTTATRKEYTVKTPNGTSVTVLKEGECLSLGDKKYWNDYIKRNYPKTKLLRSATSKYNCHSYAWYSTSSSNKYWMNDPSAYMTDGSYISSNGAKGDKVYYPEEGEEHSGIVYKRGDGPIGPDAYSILTVDSKWGAMGLVRHQPEDCPYYVTGEYLQFYERP